MGDVIERILAATIDYDKTPMPDGAEPISISCGEIREAASEIIMLREVLRGFVYEATHLSPVEADGSHWCKISSSCLKNGRNALRTKNERETLRETPTANPQES